MQEAQLSNSSEKVKLAFEHVTKSSQLLEISNMLDAYDNKVFRIDFSKSTTLKCFGYFPSFASEIILPESVVYISYEAFSEASRLETIVIPVNVVHIGEKAFYSCDELTSIKFLGKVTEFVDANSIFMYCDSLEKIEVPNEYVDYYKEQFSDYADLVVGF